MSETPEWLIPLTFEQEMKCIETLVIFDMFGTEGLEDDKMD